MALTKVIGSGLGAIPAISGANLTNLDSADLTGALPEISGANLTELVGGLVYNGGTTLGALRIQTGTATTPASSTDAGTAEGAGARYYNRTTISLSGFASAPTVFASVVTGYHEVTSSPVHAVSASSATFTTHGARTAGIQGIPFHYIAIGTAS
tara:strand:+ start:28 stop:489 length:462 start_codon:yes stop_codon:yes gene_type:complete